MTLDTSSVDSPLLLRCDSSFWLAVRSRLARSRGTAQHPLAHLRRHEPRPRLLRRQVFASPTIDRLAGRRDPLHALLHAHRRLRPEPLRHHHRHVPCSIGSQHMRSKTVLPPDVKCFTEYLREAGYYCTNNSKTDYNFPRRRTPGTNRAARPTGRIATKDQPFFAVFNFTVTHESQIRAPQKAYERNTERAHGRAAARPRESPRAAVLPDTPVVRHDMAHYYDNITAMDYLVADQAQGTRRRRPGRRHDRLLLQRPRRRPAARQALAVRLERARAADRPLAGEASRHRDEVRRAEARQPCATTSWRSSISLRPCSRSPASKFPRSCKAKRSSAPRKPEKPREYVYGARDRMDERVDMIRSVRDKQFKYIRNYEWWKPYAQNINYMNDMPTMQELRRLSAEGKLTGRNFPSWPHRSRARNSTIARPIRTR